MEKNMYLHSWDSFSKVYSLNIEKGKYRLIRRKVDESIIATGFVKEFIFGKKIAFYQIDKQWWIQYKGSKYNINDPRLYFEIKHDGLITVIVAHFDKRSSMFIDTNLGLLISRKIDPTHDSWDEENMNFIARLNELRKDWRKV
jgi:hypothetical protein